MNLYEELPVPAGDGLGTKVDVSAFDAYKTVIVSSLSGPQILTIEFSIDVNGSDDSFAPFVEFDQPENFKNSLLVARWMRVRVEGFQVGVSIPGRVWVGAQEASSSASSLTDDLVGLAGQKELPVTDNQTQNLLYLILQELKIQTHL